jgi:hypothetical protein
MFRKIRRDIKKRGDTFQVTIDSKELVPSIEGHGRDRQFFLGFKGTKYPCTERGWSSWASKVLNPGSRDRALRSKDGERWSSSTIRKFLFMTPVGVANQVIRDWWDKSTNVSWNVIRYADTDHPGSIRYIGTNRYQLYKHTDFIKDIQKTYLTGMRLAYASLTEGHMVLRLVGEKKLDVKGQNLYTGFNLCNSENGSSSISLKHIVFDEICSNGLMDVLGDVDVIRQRHTGFDMDQFREKIEGTSADMQRMQDFVTESINYLAQKKMTVEEAHALLDMYRVLYGGGDKFVDMVKGRIENPTTAWGVVSQITEGAQGDGIDWAGRMAHEEGAGRMIKDIKNDRYLDYVQEEPIAQA